MPTLLQGCCRIIGKESGEEEGAPGPVGERRGASYLSAYSVAVLPCRQHGAHCRPLRFTRPATDRAGWKETTVHEWAAELVCSADSRAAELSFSVGFDSYSALFESLAVVAPLQEIANSSRDNASAGIEPSRFYTRRKFLLKAFPRQEDAFSFCDEQRAVPLKVFSFESESMQGRRRFFGAEMAELVRRYSLIAPTERHVYEIIREGFPCRAYLDLEFAKEFNPGLDGDVLVAKVVHLLCWKVFELFGLIVGPEHVVELDSSDANKFSRHVTLLIPSTAARCKRQRGGDAELSAEVLFENNMAVGRLVAAMVEEMFDRGSSTRVASDGDARADAIDGTGLDLSAVLSKYREMWVRSRDGRLCCFIDTGVYTRNRAFRLLSSCKFGKSTVLRVSDSKTYNSCIRSRYRELDTSGGLSVQRHLSQRLCVALECSFVVPLEITSAVVASFQTKSAVGIDLSPVDRRLQLRPGANPVWGQVPNSGSFLGWSTTRIEDAAKIIPIANPSGPSGFLSPLMINLPCIMPVSTGTGMYAELRRYLRRVSPSIGLVTHDWAADGSVAPLSFDSVREIRGPTDKQGKSLFPLLDQFVEANINRGGVAGSISSWSVSVSEMSQDTHSNGNLSREAPRKIHKITYQIAGNKFCARVGRPHKSNHIMFVVDCDRSSLFQRCWDPDCRGFSSNEIRVPESCLPSAAELEEFFRAATTCQSTIEYRKEN